MSTAISNAAVPAPIQINWRITSGSSVLCDPAYDALMTLIRPTPASASTSTNSVQSKWRIILRSAIRIALRFSLAVEHARDFGLRRRRVELEITLEDVVNHGRRRAAAVTAVLNNAGRRDRRVILRREGDEPCVVLVLVGRVLFSFVLAVAAAFVADDLRG